VILDDAKPVEEDNEIQTLQSLAEGMGEDENEEEPPEPFIWSPMGNLAGQD